MAEFTSLIFVYSYNLIQPSVIVELKLNNIVLKDVTMADLLTLFKSIFVTFHSSR